MDTFSKIAAIFIVISIVGCASTGQTTSNDEDKSNIVRVSNLSNYIETIPRLDFTGKGELVNRSTSTFADIGRILYIIDGVQVGSSYGRLLTLLDPNQNVEVKFLPGRRATIRYGEAGRNGALLITRR